MAIQQGVPLRSRVWARPFWVRRSKKMGQWRAVFALSMTVSGRATREWRRSWSSCSSRRSGQNSLRTVSMAAGRGGLRLRDAVGQGAAEGDGAGAALFEAGFVEEGVGVGVEEFVGELGGDGRVDGEAADGAGFDAAEDFDEAFEVHRFLEDVLHDFVDERVVGDLDVADDGLEAGGGLGEDAGEEVFGAGALDLRGDAFALWTCAGVAGCGRRPSASGF